MAIPRMVVERRSTKSDWVIEVAALNVFFLSPLISYHQRFVSLWAISFPERNTLHAHILVQLVIVHSMCNALMQLFCCCLSPSCMVSCHVLHIYIFFFFFFFRYLLAVLSAIVNYVHNMDVVLWVYGFNTMPCFLLNDQYECQLQKAQEVRDSTSKCDGYTLFCLFFLRSLYQLVAAFLQMLNNF